MAVHPETTNVGATIRTSDQVLGLYYGLNPEGLLALQAIVQCRLAGWHISNSLD
jgi:hypothetical protein